ncbi:MAG: hypothetical protein GY899_12080 [Verrucomicrobiaceae bacterium]|nr:hypothetical protein [Verrucomicrobiaceae bacterium]
MKNSKGSAGIARTVDLDQIKQIIFYAAKSPSVAKSYEDGPLPPPWQAKAVGTLPRGGSATAKNGSIIIETSSPPKGTALDSFYTAYLPLPENDSYITARISRIDTYEETTQSGITIRGANQTGSPGVFLALSHRQPATMVQWGENYSGILPSFTSEIITRKTPLQWVNIDIDTKGATQLLLAVQDGGNSSQSNWTNWINPRITTPSGTAQKLTELNWKSATSGQGKVHKNKNAAGREIRLGGNRFDDGIGTHADSIIRFDLPPGTTRFRSTAAIDDDAPEDSSVRFLVYTANEATSLNGIPKAYYDPRKSSDVGQWLRLTRDNGLITSYISRDGNLWRKIHSVTDEIKSPAIAGLIARGTKPRRRWSTIFDHVETGPLKKLGSMSKMEPRIALVDGTIFHERIIKATSTLFHLGGDNQGRALPALSIARIEYYYPLAPQLDKPLAGRQEGLILSNGDFFASKFSGITDNTLTTRSALFGKRNFELSRAIDAIVLRPASKNIPKGCTYVLETWRGGRIYGRNLRVADQHFKIDTIRLRTQTIPYQEIRRISRI